MFRAGSANLARAVAASGSKKAAFTTSAAKTAPIRVGINGFGRIGRLVRAWMKGCLDGMDSSPH